MRYLTVLAIATAGASCAPAIAAPAFHLVGPGFVPYDISDNGVVAGANLNTDQYVTWSVEEGGTQIGGSSFSSYAGTPSISNDGTRISGTIFNPVSGKHEMAIYNTTTSTWTPLGSLGASSGESASSGWGMSGDGNHVVGLGWVSGSVAHATQWSDGGGPAYDLGSTVAGRSSRANAVDFDGNLVVGWQDNDFGTRQGAYWNNGTQTVMSGPDGAILGEGLAVSGDGRYVTGIYSNFIAGNRTYRYDTVTGTAEYLDAIDFHSGITTTYGEAISDDGKTIVGSGNPFGPAILARAFIWREGHGTMYFGDYLDSMGVDYDPSLTFLGVYAMSGDGDTFSGWASGSNGVVGWVITIPAPSTGALLLGTGVFAFRRRR